MNGCMNAAGLGKPAKPADMLPKPVSEPAAQPGFEAPGGAPVEPPSDKLTREILAAQDSVTSSKLIAMLEENEVFVQFSKDEGDAILARDQEDAEKLAIGIDFAISKGVLEAKEFPPYTQVDVFGKTADQVAAEITTHLGSDFKGGVLVLVGLSGTGKGTTVSKLKEMLPNATTWSNGNIFRCLTLLAATHCLQNGLELNKSVLTPANISAWMGMLEFGKFETGFDIHVKGMGHDMFVSQVANTVLKGPMVGKNIPTVAEVSQGEVVKFASDACKVMGEGGVSVLLEGREQTVNYIISPHRFELTMSDAKLIGMRRAAQRIGAKAHELVGQVPPAVLRETCADEVEASVTMALTQLTS